VNRYRIEQADTGEPLGVYEAETAAEAFAEMLGDAACTDAPDPGLRAYLVPDYCTQCDGECQRCALVSHGLDCFNNPVRPPVAETGGKA
jgi:hypothetical protein